MIINCPVYLEVDDKFTPQEGREFTLGIRQYLVDSIVKDLKGKPFYVNFPVTGKNYAVRVLTESEALARFGKNVSKSASQASKENQK
jgi:hypothetical protein